VKLVRQRASICAETRSRWTATFWPGDGFGDESKQALKVAQQMRSKEHQRTRVHPRQRNRCGEQRWATCAGMTSLRILKMRQLAANQPKWLTEEAIRQPMPSGSALTRPQWCA
jgi:hypothetical protein